MFQLNSQPLCQLLQVPNFTDHTTPLPPAKPAPPVLPISVNRSSIFLVAQLKTLQLSLTPLTQPSQMVSLAETTPESSHCSSPLTQGQRAEPPTTAPLPQVTVEVPYLVPQFLPYPSYSIFPKWSFYDVSQVMSTLCPKAFGDSHTHWTKDKILYSHCW